jgi:hypothetical protein
MTIAQRSAISDVPAAGHGEERLFRRAAITSIDFSIRGSTVFLRATVDCRAARFDLFAVLQTRPLFRRIFFGNLQAAVIANWWKLAGYLVLRRGIGRFSALTDRARSGRRRATTSLACVDCLMLPVSLKLANLLAWTGSAGSHLF